MKDEDFPWIKNKYLDYLADDRQVMESREPKLNIEEAFPLPHGEQLVLLTSKVPLLDEHKKVYGVLGIAYNITSQKQIEENARLAHARLEHAFQEAQYLQNSLIDCIPNYFIFWKDINSVYLGCNAAYAATAGVHSSANIIGKTDYELPWSKKESDAYRADDQLVMRSRQAKLNIVEPQTLADGTKIVLLTSKVPLINEKNEVYGVLGIYSDITEQKMAEQKLIDINKRLELAYKTKNEFIRNVSHDIRTPLSGIQQTTRLIAEGKISEEEIPEYAFQAFEASNQLMNLFNQIIEISKKENFEFEDRVVKFDLYKLLNDLKKTYEVVAKHKGLALEIKHAEEIPHYLLGKNQRLHRILLNLLGNALKFTSTGSIKLSVEKAHQDEGKIILRFNIADTGIGIPAEKYETIFEPFERLQPSYQGQYHGSGLGLHVVKEYVDRMQGEIYLKSVEGQGSIFTCILPFKLPMLQNESDVVEMEYVQVISIDKPTTSISLNASEKKSDKMPDEKPYQVLLVEDNMLAQNMGKIILGNIEGYNIDTASSGEEALSICIEKKYDLKKKLNRYIP